MPAELTYIRSARYHFQRATFQSPAIMTLLSLLVGILVLLCCAILALQIWIISECTCKHQVPSGSTPKISPPPSPQGSSCYADQSSHPTRAVSSPGPKCFRVTNIPPEWSNDDLLQSLRGFQPSLDHFDGPVSLYPACCDTTSQTALLNLKTCPEFFQDIGPDDTKHLKIQGQSLDKTVVLSVDSHFYDLTPLNKPEGEIVADVIAVTGLAGHAFGSWRDRGSRDMWLQDFLPQDFKNIRIMSYGYNSSLDGDSNNGLLDFRRHLVQQLENARSSDEAKNRHIIFVAHSLGGILILQALIQSKSRSVHQPILDSTRAIFFFGTPHQGLRTAELEDMVEDLSGGVETSRLRLLMQLRENSEFLETQRDALADIWPGRKIISFYEVEKTRVVQKLTEQTYQRNGELVEMVKKVSAQLYIPGEYRLPVERNHTELVKFPTRGNSTYQSVVYYMRHLFTSITCCMRSKSTLEPSESQKKLIEALNAPKVDAFIRNVENAANGTFTWFLEEQTFRSWTTAKQPSSLLIIGAPGQGKTVLSKFLLQHLKKKKLKNVMIIYFFCSDRDNSFNTVNSLLRSLVTQLLCGSAQVRKILKPYEKDPAKSVDSNDTLWEMFQAAIKDSCHNAMYCLIDGLDELEKHTDGKERTKFLFGLKELFATQTDPIGPQSSALKFLGTSRQIPEIVNKLRGLTRFDLKAKPEDLKIFVDQRISDLPESFGNELREQAARLLMDEAKGTFFLWVSIVVKRLENIDFPTVAGLKKTIEESSTDLDTLYDDIFRQINQRSEFAQKLVVWVVYGQRPLTLKELEAALATQMDSKDENSTKDHKTDLTSKSLASILGVILETTAEGFVHLIHQSAKDFIIDRNLFVNSSFGTNIDPNVYIAKVCMTYLNFDDFKLGHKNYKPKIEALKRSHPLLDYTARHWYSHIRNKSEVEHCFDLLLQIITPPSTLRFWSTVANIRPRDAYARDHPLDVATNADIEWLASYLLSTENKHIEVAKNELEYAMRFGSDSITAILLLSTHPDIQITEKAVATIAQKFDDGIMKLLLSTHSDVQITEPIVTAVAGNWGSGKEVMELLLSTHPDIQITEPIVTAAAGNAGSGKEVMERLLSTHPDIQITEKAMVTIAQKFDGGIMKLLLSTHPDIQITEPIVTAAAGNWGSGKEVMELLLSTHTDIQITEKAEAVATIAQKFDIGIMKLLLSTHPDIQITELIVTVAAGNAGSGKEVMELLLSTHPDIQITEPIVTAAAGNWGNPKEVMELLLSTDTDIQITEKAVAKIAQKFDGGIMKLLLSTHPDVQITEPIVTAAAKNRGNAMEVMELLLSTHPDIQITEPIVTAVAGNRGNAMEVMELLLSTHPDIQITEPIVTAAAGNAGSGKEVMELLLSTHPDIQITEPIVTAAAGNEKNAKEVMELLLSTHPDIQITEPIVTAAAGNWNGKQVMELLLSTHPNIQITEPIVTAAAGNKKNAKEVMELLL
ncbi:hypothetical protein BDD12DRAFT_779452, partial [Trichophaea hybrida]